MNKKAILLLACCFGFGTSLVIILYARTNHAVYERNEFYRVYKTNTTGPLKKMDIGFNSYYAAGTTKQNIYLANITAPFHVLILNQSLTDSQHVKIRIKGESNPTISRSSIVRVDSPFFYLADGKKPAIYRGKINNWIAELIPNSNEYFVKFEPLTENSFAVRTNSAQTGENVLGKIQLNPYKMTINESLLVKQIDGIFCTDGTLLFNRDLKKLIYTHYYRNEYIVYDTGLNLSYRGHTIDTFSQARIKISHVSSDSTNTLTDRKYVVIRSGTSSKYLFTWTRLIAKNDDEDMIKNQSIIDVYDLEDKKYKFSFLIPYYQGIQMRDFFTIDTKYVVALYDKYIVRYELRQNSFSNK